MISSEPRIFCCQEKVIRFYRICGKHSEMVTTLKVLAFPSCHYTSRNYSLRCNEMFHRMIRFIEVSYMNCG